MAALGCVDGGAVVAHSDGGLPKHQRLVHPPRSPPSCGSTTTQDSDDPMSGVETPPSSLPPPSLQSTLSMPPRPCPEASCRRLVFCEDGLGRPLLSKPFASSASHLAADLKDSRRVYWESFFVVFPMFCGYAALFGMQHHVKAKLGIQDDRSARSYAFGFAVSTLFISNLFIRFGHNFIFCCVVPRVRVFISMALMITAQLFIAVPIFVLGSQSLSWVVLAYSLGGLGIGSFESNILGCLTPLGHPTKHVAITAIPAGVNGVLIGGFFWMGPPINAQPGAIYAVVALLILCGMAVMSSRIPHDSTMETGVGGLPRASGSSSQRGRGKLLSDMRCWREWLPVLWHYSLATTLNMFALSAFAPGVTLYVYDKESVTLWPGCIVNTDTFMAVVNSGNLVGGLAGRWLSYQLRPRHPVTYSLFSLSGIWLVMQWNPVLAPLGTFLILMGDGLIYGSISRFIDASIPQDFNVIAISTWLFIGDVGSVLGSSLTTSIRGLVRP